ncbi:MAG TPA: hypothetical protein VLD19_19250, partial [Chitinophagaceae bacterium]|nr:hypothetical protein [Chitinophagaceae bacterium]
MTPPDIISAYRKTPGKQAHSELIDFFSFKPIGSGSNELSEVSLAFRTSIVEQLLHDFSERDIQLVRDLFSEEMKCEISTGRHDNLYQLCYYLFEIGKLEDSFIIYDAKFNAQNMDVGCMLDREMITVGHHVDEVINYVQEEFKKNPELQAKY